MHSSSVMLAPFGILALIAIVVVVAIVVGLVVILISSKRRCDTQPAAPVADAAPLPSRAERQAVLKKLAAGELTKQEAEEQLGQLGTPVPANVPAPPPRQGGGKGCLIAVLVAVLLLPLLLLLLVGGIGGCRWHQMGKSEALRHEQVERMHMEMKEAMAPVEVNR
jgi:uncharacterized membrane protein